MTTNLEGSQISEESTARQIFTIIIIIIIIIVVVVCTGDTLMEGVELIPLLIQTLEKAASQPTQVQQVTEAGAVVNLIAKLLTADHNIPGMCDKYTVYFWYVQ